MALLFLLVAYPIYFTATRKLKYDKLKLNEKVQQQAIVFDQRQTKLVKNQRTLLTLAKESFSDQAKALKKMRYPPRSKILKTFIEVKILKVRP